MVGGRLLTAWAEGKTESSSLLDYVKSVSPGSFPSPGPFRSLVIVIQIEQVWVGGAPSATPTKVHVPHRGRWSCDKKLKVILGYTISSKSETLPVSESKKQQTSQKSKQNRQTTNSKAPRYGNMLFTLRMGFGRGCLLKKARRDPSEI